MALKREKNKKLKVAFPHMGTISIAWAAGLRKVGVEPFRLIQAKKHYLTEQRILPKQFAFLIN